MAKSRLCGVRELEPIDEEIRENQRLVDKILTSEWSGVRDSGDLEDLRNAGLLGLSYGLRSAGDRRGAHRARFLCRYIRFAMLDFWRSAKGRLSRSRSKRRQESIPDDVQRLLVAEWGDAEAAARCREELLQALGRMTGRQREAALLVWGLGVSAAEAASIIGTTENNVHQHLMRARWAGQCTGAKLYRQRMP